MDIDRTITEGHPEDIQYAKGETIYGMPADINKLVIQKSNAIFEIKDLNLAEYKIIDTYLSRINSRDRSKRVVRFEKGELERILGVQKINGSDLDEFLRSLAAKTNFQISYRRDEADNEIFIKNLRLFESARADWDIETGLWTITLACSLEMIDYIFDLGTDNSRNDENKQYIKYRLVDVRLLQSQYSYRLLMYVLKNRFRKTWTVKICDLKVILGVPDKPTYQKYKTFNDKILKRCCAEIKAKSNCVITYQAVKKGKMVVALTITYISPYSVPGHVNAAANCEISESKPQVSGDAEKRFHEMWEDAVRSLDPSDAQIHELKTLLVQIPKGKLPQNPNLGCGDSLEAKWYSYLDMRVATIDRQDQMFRKKYGHGIRDKYAYLVKMMRNDIG